ncbi:MAG: response regulator transcription factor [Chloroflexi bacterium]|nr:response regulator transcription factor [Chloroflexota bacterium]
MIRVALADREALMAQAIARLIDMEPDMRTTAIYSDGRDLLRGLTFGESDVLLLEPAGLTLTGFQLIHRLRVAHPGACIVILTSSEREQDLFTAIRAGVQGFISKFSDVSEVPSAIRAAHDGSAVLSREQAAQLMAEFARRTYDQTGLAPRQRELLVGIVQGKSNQEIATDLSLTEKTVKNYMRDLFSVLGARNRTEAAVCALQMDLVPEREWASPIQGAPLRAPSQRAGSAAPAALKRKVSGRGLTS